MPLRTLPRVVAKRFIQAGYQTSDGRSLYTCHGIRRGSVQHAIRVKHQETGVLDLEMGRRLLGHKSLKTTQLYAQEVLAELEAGMPIGHALLSPDVNDYKESEPEAS